MARNRDDDDRTADDGKPARNAPAPVIRRLAVAEEDGRTRLLKRQVPAVVMSGLIHIVLVSIFLLYFKYFPDKDKEVKAKEIPTTTKIDEPPVKDDDLTIPDLGLDSDLAAAVEVERETDLNVEAPVVDNENAGLPNHDKDFASQTANLGTLTNVVGDPGSMNAATDAGIIGMGQGGAGGNLALPGLQGRSGATREKLLRAGGGNDETEAAVARALVWLSKQQNVSGGYWEFDGSHKRDRVAATGMCLLPFLAAGETHMTGKKYRTHVGKGLAYLKGQLQPSGQFKGAGMYSQAIATIALCEAAGMTQDDGVKKAAKGAVDFIVKAQAGNGSWGYSAGEAGDTSIVGWQIQALKSAKLAGIVVPDKAFKQAESFLESVSDSGATYGYRTKGSTHTLTAVALLSRQYMGWSPRVSQLARGVQYMWKGFPPREDDWNIYYYYYATQVFHFFDGPAWHKDWNPLMREILLKRQITEKTPNAKAGDVGSWPKDGHFIGSSCGKLGTTALACLTLEVYYRHLPLYKRDSAGLQELERGN